MLGLHRILRILKLDHKIICLTCEKVFNRSVGGEEDVRFVEDPSLEDISMDLSLVLDVLSGGADKLQGLVSKDAVAQVAWDVHFLNHLQRSPQLDGS